jgi:hypothetical protein
MYSKYYANRDARAAASQNKDQEIAGLTKAGGHSYDTGLDHGALHKNQSLGDPADAALRNIGEIDSRGRYSTYFHLHFYITPTLIL